MLVMGSSTVALGISVNILEDKVLEATGDPITVSNVGQFGGNMLMCNSILKDILKWKGRSIKTVVLGVDINRFNPKGFKKVVYFECYADQREILLSLDELLVSGNFEAMVQGFLRDTSNLLWCIAKSPFQFEGHEMLERLEKSREDNLLGRDVVDMNNLERRREIRDWNESLEDYTISEDADQGFKDFISLCGKHNISLSVVNMPIHGDLINDDTEQAYQIFIEYISSVCESRGIEFFNLQEEINTLDDTHFFNLSHLNGRGIAIASQYVSDRILLPDMLPQTSKDSLE